MYKCSNKEIGKLCILAGISSTFLLGLKGYNTTCRMYAFRNQKFLDASNEKQLKGNTINALGIPDDANGQYAKYIDISDWKLISKSHYLAQRTALEIGWMIPFLIINGFIYPKTAISLLLIFSGSKIGRNLDLEDSNPNLEMIMKLVGYLTTIHIVGLTIYVLLRIRKLSV